ncbi:multivesicular body subunit 12B [Coccinella septempunctata]|uniref:multivesicular body subunit 12B n=1 Tax=Coccinella septempunctata TaxID=41139 RepID=UPI001D06FE33|nr:multivesicular body subunit 12B [Coccinella septempunctata]XP_044757451.1 multivesicular body subunit 12B [Coccinella septempunctata]XP_044757452.1 multivesicular body subunit 12B [Coccinella septempunctata]XP_044757453.1 multivesicular body subunit 12B [Coccinella septempunctata]
MIKSLSALRRSAYATLPDDRPVTAITIVENISNCPPGFYPVSRTYDQDQDADLKESSIFKSSQSRYLCLSKTEGLPNFVISDLVVTNEKGVLPIGYSLLNRTTDTEQKAWKKKLISYRLVNLKHTKVAITDIIVCSRLKKAPEGFDFAGEINGVTICYKMGNVQDSEAASSQPQAAPNKPPRPAPPPPIANPSYPNLQDDDHDYEILLPSYPRPNQPPPVPTSTSQNNTNTLNVSNAFSAMEGVPFVINPAFLTSANASKVTLPSIKAKSMQQILRDYSYPFSVERQT